MNRLMIVLFVAFLLTSAGCGSKQRDPGPMSEEMKQKVKEEDRRIDEEERGGSGTATPRKKRR